MTTVEMKVDALCRMMLGTSEEERNIARTNLCKLMDQPVQPENMESVIGELLTEIGVTSGIVGYRYLVFFIKETVKDPGFINAICKAYSSVADKFGTTGSRVERGVRHAIESAWERGDVDVLHKYFGNTVSADKGKPTNKEFISRMANIVRSRVGC